MYTYVVVSFVASPEIVSDEVIKIPHNKSEGIIRNPLVEQYIREMHRCIAALGTHE